ncbi:IPT/TIG domain-containing protein [Actinokineospora sp. NBRC 105648]|uniref:IPT/TIG domain-containing protein n=1 Tax=Actinokineospora sp. NBRC 105648 TaxID=3032206 RepID=UPI0024A28C59|nr:IPT/TIG domain-containing protein [Actinokineospora sp. NBRC 105648]GLZ39722.1 hypothetical protein Acsp05_33460 [Actinokineospora sp. NBRC 105648]
MSSFARARHRLLAVAATSALASGGLVVLAAPAYADGVCADPVVVGTTTTITCAAGGTGSVTVPTGVSSAAVTLDGAGGGNAVDGTPGGKGAHIVAALPTTPGEVFQVAVGIRGNNGQAAPSNGIGGGGGGLVAVTAAGGAALLTAGSGGGAGGAGIGSPAYPGTPGADSGSPGAGGAGLADVAQGGGGGGQGTATAGGTGGTGGVGTRPGSPGAPGGFPNALGGSALQTVPPQVGAGGRGGAGYGGGGRGGSGAASGTGAAGAGGAGGGGSNFVSSTVPGLTATVTDGANAGNGLVVFVFTLDPPTVTSITPTSGPEAGGTAVTITGTYLAGTTAITFGPGNPATGVSCTATTCTATAPPGTGAVDVQVTTPGGTTSAGQFTYIPPATDIAVDVTAKPHLGILVPYLTYTLTAHNTGPAAVTSATLTATLPPGAHATNLSAGCTTTTGTVTCAYDAIANGAATAKSFRVPLHLFSLGHVSVTGVRTASSPADPNPANDRDTATCAVISFVLATCP